MLRNEMSPVPDHFSISALRGGLRLHAIFSVHFSRFSLLSLRGFMKLKKAVIKPVVRGPRNLSEFFPDF